MSDAVEIRTFQEDDLEPIIEFSLRAWEPVFASMRSVLGDEIFLGLYGDWRTQQATEIRTSCTTAGRAVFVATVKKRQSGS